MDSETHREDGHRKTEAEIGTRRLQAKECQGLPTGAGKSREGFSSRTFRKDAALLTTCCPTCNLQNQERKDFCIITPPTLWCSINGSLRKLDSVHSIEIFNRNFKKQICLSPKIKLLLVILQVLSTLKKFFLNYESMITHLHETWKIQKIIF